MNRWNDKQPKDWFNEGANLPPEREPGEYQIPIDIDETLIEAAQEVAAEYVASELGRVVTALNQMKKALLLNLESYVPKTEMQLVAAKSTRRAIDLFNQLVEDTGDTDEKFTTGGDSKSDK